MSEARNSPYRGHRFPAEVIGHAVWLYFRFPLSLRMAEDLLAARGIVVNDETVRCWAERFGRDFAGTPRRRARQFGDKWHLDEVVMTIGGHKHRLWRAVEHRQHEGLNNRAENSHQPRRRRERVMKRFKSARHLQRSVSVHDPIANLFHFPRHSLTSADYRTLRPEAMTAWHDVARIRTAA